MNLNKEFKSQSDKSIKAQKYERPDGGTGHFPQDFDNILLNALIILLLIRAYLNKLKTY